MAAGDILSILWRLFDRLSFSHVLSGAVQSAPGGGGLPWSDSKLRPDACLWYPLHLNGGSLHTCSFPRECIDIHDGICLGTSQRRCQNELFGILHISCTIPPMVVSSS